MATDVDGIFFVGVSCQIEGNKSKTFVLIRIADGITDHFPTILRDHARKGFIHHTVSHDVLVRLHNAKATICLVCITRWNFVENIDASAMVRIELLLQKTLLGESTVENSRIGEDRDRNIPQSVQGRTLCGGILVIHQTANLVATPVPKQPQRHSQNVVVQRGTVKKLAVVAVFSKQLAVIRDQYDFHRLPVVG
jgi:hypothetical protein